MTGAFGAGIQKSDNASQKRDFTQLLDPGLIGARHLKKADFIIFAANGCHMGGFARKHDAFNHGLSAVYGFLWHCIHLLLSMK
ncbi:hypothetical protein D3C75_994950 [compost metagenome]